MNVLALDCSSDILSVCVARVGEQSAAPKPKHPYRETDGHGQRLGFVSVSIDAGFRHVERVMSVVDYCVREAGLKASELDILAAAGGPGSFTGLRIGLATLKGLALGLAKPFVTVPTLDALAADWAGVAPLTVPLLDAKRSRFYCAIYRGTSLVSGPFDIEADKLLALLEGQHDVLFVGPDADMLEPLIQGRAGYTIAAEHKRSPVYAMAALAADIYAKRGPAQPHCGLMYIRKSDAEEAKS